MTLYFIVKYLHVLGAIVILGTGTGIAFFMLMAHQSRDVAFIARTAATVVIADMLFTLTAVLLQPVTGGLLMVLSVTTLAERWLVSSLGLYAVAGLFWIPVIFMQIGADSGAKNFHGLHTESQRLVVDCAKGLDDEALVARYQNKPVPQRAEAEARASTAVGRRTR